MSNPHIIWKFEAPPGTRFVNEVGSGATLYFGPGMEMDVYAFLFAQLQKHLQGYLAMEAAMQSQSITPAKHLALPVSPVTDSKEEKTQ